MMRRSKWWSALIILLLSASRLKDAEACTCIVPEPQTQFCNSEWVALVRIENFEQMRNSGSTYAIKLHSIFKASGRAKKALEQHLMLWTPSMMSTCSRTNMKRGETWVVSGTMLNDVKPYISLCTLAIPWEKVTNSQREDFQWRYERNCIRKTSNTDIAIGEEGYHVAEDVDWSESMWDWRCKQAMWNWGCQQAMRALGWDHSA